VTLVFIHGWLLSRHYWQPVVDDLTTDFQCLTYDLRGFGESNCNLEARSLGPNQAASAIPHPFSLKAYAEDLGALLKALELNQVWLIGHSLGGSVALWAASLFPDVVQGVVCVNAGGGIYLPDEFARFRTAGQQIVRWRPRWLHNIPFIHYVFAKMMVFQPLALPWGTRRVTDLLAAHHDAAAGVLLESTTESEVHRLPQVVAELCQPVHFIGGANDTVMEIKYVNHLASFHALFDSPDGNVTVLPECGHMAMVEQPEAVASTIRQCVQTAKPPQRSTRTSVSGLLGHRYAAEQRDV
jgi:pimeloyl-ACP methyl ester carboxylesterase